MKALLYILTTLTILTVTRAIAFIPDTDSDGPYEKNNASYSGPGLSTELFQLLQLGISAIIGVAILAGLFLLLNPVFFNQEKKNLTIVGKVYLTIAFFGFFYLLFFVWDNLFG